MKVVLTFGSVDEMVRIHLNLISPANPHFVLLI